MTLHKQYSTGPNNAHNAYDQNPPTISKIRIVPITSNHRAKDISHTMAKWHHRLPVKTSSMCMVKTSSSITKWLSWDKQPGGYWLKKILTHGQLLIREILLFFTALSVQKVCLTSNVRAGVFSN